MPAVNQQLAVMFQEMADSLHILGEDSFRAVAFEKIARVLDSLETDIAQIGPDVKKLAEIEGVGKGSAARIAEFLQTGKIKDHDELLAKFPPSLRGLLRVPGLGPKTIALLWKECGVTSVDDLREKLKTDELSKVKGLGEKKVEAFRKALSFVDSAGKRVPIGRALPIAQWFVEQLRQIRESKEGSGVNRWTNNVYEGQYAKSDLEELESRIMLDFPVGPNHEKTAWTVLPRWNFGNKLIEKKDGNNSERANDVAQKWLGKLSSFMVSAIARFRGVDAYPWWSDPSNAEFVAKATGKKGLYAFRRKGGRVNDGYIGEYFQERDNKGKLTGLAKRINEHVTTGRTDTSPFCTRLGEHYEKQKGTSLTSRQIGEEIKRDFEFTIFVIDDGLDKNQIGVRGIKQVAYAGSIRRGKETIGDIDLLVAADESDAAAVSDAFVKLEPVGEVLAKGATKTSIRTRSNGNEGMQVDLRVIPPRSYGAALLYFTGSKEHNIALRERAIKRGMKLNEYGLLEGEKFIAGKTEEEIYKALGLAWIPPELREDTDEIELAESGKLPKLLEAADIKAELHAHTTASDGSFSIRELAMTAFDHGFHTIAVTDHSKSQVIANGLSVERLEQHIIDVRAVAAELKNKINVLAGTEVDILADGTLDYPNSVLKELDIVVASPHAALSQEPAKATKRLIKAIENPYVTILGHPTGRLVARRDGLHPDMHEIIAAAKERGIALEINANHHRLDLRDTHARLAVEAGVVLAIDTDAHGPGDFSELVYGVLTARRAGATAQNVVNCFSREALAKWIASTRNK